MGCYPFPTVTPEFLSSSVCIPITEYRRQSSFQVTEIYSYCFDGCKILVHEAQLSCAPAALASNTVPYCFVPQRRGMLCPHVRQCVKESRGISFIKLGISQGTQYHLSSLPFLDLTAMLKHSNRGSTDPIHRVRPYENHLRKAMGNLLTVTHPLLPSVARVKAVPSPPTANSLSLLMFFHACVI